MCRVDMEEGFLKEWRQHVGDQSVGVSTCRIEHKTRVRVWLPCPGCCKYTTVSVAWKQPQCPLTGDWLKKM